MADRVGRGRHRRVRRPLLERLGRSTARHPWSYLAFWAVAIAISFATSLGAIGGASLFDRLETGDIETPGEASQGRALLIDAQTEGPVLLLAVDGADLRSPATSEAVSRLVADLTALPEVAHAASPMTTPGWPQASTAYAMVEDGDPATGGFVVLATLEADLPDERQSAVIEQVRDLGTDALTQHAEQVRLGGVPLLVDDITGQIAADLTTGEGIALPVSLLVMVAVFGGFLAAGMPIVGAIASIGGGLVTLLGFSYVLELDASVVNIVTVMGLALCIDYGLLLVSRFREEVRAVAPGVAHRDLNRAQVEEALVRTVGTAGRTVLFSALIVGISLSGLMLFEAPIMQAIGAAGVSVVGVALLVALTLVPALCSVAARRLGRRRGAEVAPDDGWFSALASRVQRRPALTALGCVAVLLVLASPATELRLTSSGVELLPPGSQQRVFFEDLAADYPALAEPAVTVVADAPVEEVQQWAQSDAAALPGVVSVAPAEQVGDLVAVGLRTAGGPLDDDARELVEQVRDHRPAFPTWVTGQAASLSDFTDSVRDRALWAALWIAGATFVLLFLMTGSVVIPVKALLLNIVSLGASLGLLVWVFQNGHLDSLLRFESTGAIEAVIPLLVLAFGFGLSMDYEVFLLSRIIELHEEGLDDDTAVRLGLQRSGRIITSAALIMVIVFAGFASGKMLVIKQTGFALATAVLIDATIVRMLIVPATMTMLGRWNWWAPAWLTRLHVRYGVREHRPSAEHSPVASAHQSAGSTVAPNR